MKKIFTCLTLLLCVTISLWSQNKQFTDAEYESWNRIRNKAISAHGDWVMYTLSPNKGDATLVLHHIESGKDVQFDRVKRPQFDYSGTWAAFHMTASADSILTLKRADTDKDDMPKDTLVLFNLNTREIQYIPEVLSYKFNEKAGGVISYHLAPQKIEEPDSTQKALKKESRKNGSKLIAHHLNSGVRDTFQYVKKYQVADEATRLFVHSTGEVKKDSLMHWLAYDFDTRNMDTIIIKKGEYPQFNIDQTGDQAAFIAHFDTTDALIKPHQLYKWKRGEGLEKIADPNSTILKEGQKISEHYEPRFSEEGNRIIYGIADHPILQDTSLLDEEIVNVEVWSTDDTRLFTRQNANLSEDEEASYMVAYDIDRKSNIQLSSKHKPRVRVSDKASHRYAVASHTEFYDKEVSWLGLTRRDIYAIDLSNGMQSLITKETDGTPSLSPAGKYAYWYSRKDTAWYAYEFETKKKIQLTSNDLGRFYDEINDRPMHPWSYGDMGWSENDEYIYLYDRYDIWEFDMKTNRNKKLTDGHKDQIRYRYEAIDEELEFVPRDSTLMLAIFDSKDKSTGYASIHLADRKLKTLHKDHFEYESYPLKARLSDVVLTTKESFKVFPDLLITNTDFKKYKRISDANPQQKEYAWGSIEPYSWTAPSGQKVDGMVVKPANFDPNKKYPLIVNFYEKSSDRLHRHRAPAPGRSTINYTVYAAKGYVIFNPDVWYTDGYPGQSCYDHVISGVEALLKEGYIDRSRMGVQGHSWGGYQIAHLLTKTDMFKCAEAGAPVVNMTSAYGGIRWRSGRSRMFQYEHTQSRIGGTLWDKPDLYLENSPLFNTDKVNTPVLILHNDKDGAVPWYQGIEYFVALRRLGKKAWMLNYNGEPHWPVKWQNRMDFQKRMAQFFDHYLLDQPMPSWMKNGMKATEKSKKQGLELVE